ncbi:hypothetical protein I4U23_015868 [Adineta vaga]|nr:hypothetical protein I4U23_015868 [Adineta vaga]
MVFLSCNAEQLSNIRNNYDIYGTRLINNLTLTNGDDFDYVMSLSIEHETQQILVSLPCFTKTYLLKFTNTQLTTNPSEFIRLTVSNGQSVILTSAGLVLYVPRTPAGYCSEITEISASMSRVIPYLAGTFNNNIDSNPCTICTNGFKKDDSVLNIECLPCLSTSLFYPLASINDINQSNYPSINQGYPYPNSPTITNFDDYNGYSLLLTKWSTLF